MPGPLGHVKKDQAFLYALHNILNLCTLICTFVLTSTDDTLVKPVSECCFMNGNACSSQSATALPCFKLQVRALMVAQRDQQLLLESSAASHTQPQLEGQSQHPALPSTSVTSTAAGATATTAASASQAGEAALVLRSPPPQQQLAQRMPQQSARPGSDFSSQPIPNLPALPTTASRPDAQRMLGMYEQAMQTRAKAEASARMPLPVASTSGRQPGPMQGGPGQQGESSSRGEAARSSGVTAGPPASATTQPAVVRVRRPQQPASATDSTGASSSGPAGSSGNNSSSRVIEQEDASGSQASGAVADAVAGTGAGAPIGDGLVAGAVESGPAGTVSGDVLSKGSGQAPSSAVP